MNNLLMYFSSNLFTITTCQKAYVGIDMEHVLPNNYKLFPWDSSPENPFSDLSENRIYMVTEGEATLITKNGDIELKEGNIYFFPANSIIATKCDCLMHHYYLHFSINSSVNYLEFIDYTQSIPVTKEKIEVFEKLIYLTNINSTLNKLSDLKLKEGFLANFIAIDGYFKILLSCFFDKTLELNQDINKFHNVLDYINNNLNKTISLNDLSQIMRLTPVYFSNFFTKTFHITPMKYIAEKKLLLAKKLLLNSSLTIKEISEHCGFADQFYFSNWFHKLTTQYPITFRNSHL